MLLKPKSKIILADSGDCTGCAACINVCPKSCINMQEDEEGFLQPKIDVSLCIECHKCEKTCPVKNVENIPQNFKTKVYAAFNPDEDVRIKSSSGGIFFLLSKWIIEHGGVVFGARWNEKWEVVHDYTEDLNSIKLFMQSKYVQSKVGDTYIQASAFLKQDRWVLYSGTPCQLGGLRAYLKNGYDKLLQVDLICHGVPSPGVWRKYLVDYVGNESIISINMRDKTSGWDGAQSFVTTTHSSIKRELQMSNPYLKGFLRNIYLRRSCYSCKFLGLHRATDITLADFWGVKDIRPDLWNNLGVSLVFAHSDKGQNVFSKINAQLFELSAAETNQAIENNPSLIYSCEKSIIRDVYFMHYRWLGFKTIEPLINRRLISYRIIRLIKRILIGKHTL